MKKILWIFALLLTGMMVGCVQVEESWVNWEDTYAPGEAKTFVPFREEVHTMGRDEFDACWLPGGVSMGAECNEEEDTDAAYGAPMRTSGIDGITLAKSLFSYWHSDQSRSYCGSYMSTDEDGNPIRLSGRLILPIDGKVKRIMIISHFTIGADYEAPSRSFPLEAIFAARGIAVLMPDYMGFGTSVDRVHPYLCNLLTAKHVTDMYFAVLPFLEHIGCKPENDDILLMGYSQGGATTMAVQRYFELVYPEVKIRLNMAGGGPYNPCVTYDKMIEQDISDYPCVIPMIIMGMKMGEHLNIDYADFMKPYIVEHLDEWINSKQYVVYQLTELFGTKHVTQLLTEDAKNKVNEGMSDFYLALYSNSLTSGWQPVNPIYLFHSMDDNVVPFDNAVLFQQMAQQQSNVIYNFGHYGTHRKAMLRFLYTCIELLYEHGDIDKKF